MLEPFTPALIAFGSNEGDSQAIFRAAVDRIAQLGDVEVVAVSDPVVTRPVTGHAEGRKTGTAKSEEAESDYLNAVIRVDVKAEQHSRTPQWLLNELLAIESEFGRVRKARWAQRTIDLDLLLFGQQVVCDQNVEIPHPRMSFRRFVLEPANEIAPKLIHPVCGCSLQHLLASLNRDAAEVSFLMSQESESEVDEAILLANQQTQKIFFDPKLLQEKVLERAEILKRPVIETNFSDWFGGGILHRLEETKLLIVIANIKSWQWSKLKNRFSGPTLLLLPDSSQLKTEIRAALEAI